MSIRQVELQRKPTLSYFHHRALAALLTTGRDAAEGAVGGQAAGKAGDAEQEKSQVVKNCM